MNSVIRPMTAPLMLVLGLAGPPGSAQETSAPAAPRIAGLEVALERFQNEIWPLLRRGGEASCVGCHAEENDDNKSGLVLYPDPRSNFLLLVDDGYFDADDPDGLLARVSAERRTRRMPPGKLPSWSAAEVETLLAFARDLERRLAVGRESDDRRAGDEAFPVELQAPYEGSLPSGLDNSFLTYTQLRGKIRTIFGDDGVRADRELFAENLALLGGADFKTRFNESSRASPSFLGALDTIAIAVGTRAFNQRRGPFEGRRLDLVPPVELAGPDEAHRTAIRRLYRSILLRDPEPDEIARSFRFLQEMFGDADVIRDGDYDLTIELAVTEGEHGLGETRLVTVPVGGVAKGRRGLKLGLTQTYIDQSAGEPADGKGDLVQRRLDGLFVFATGIPGQHVRISNLGTHENVSLHAVKLVPEGVGVEGREALTWTVDHASVAIEGAWKQRARGGFTSYENDAASKEPGRITIPVSVPEDGRYEVHLLWRASAKNDRGVLVEVVSPGRGRLETRAPPSPPPPGEARYFIDQSEDTVAFRELEGRFRFSGEGYVEINNAGTDQRVTADAVRFEPDSSGLPARGEAFLIDNHEADGREDWKPFKARSFGAYNRVGPDTYHDENERKGELFLRYRPAVKKDVWVPGKFYRVRVGSPAKRDHETRAPVIVRATASSPIISLGAPTRAVIGSTVRLDASATYTVHQAPLEFRWRRIAGPEIEFRAVEGAGGAAIEFEAPHRNVEEVAWVALCRALLRHPDFLFTRAPTLARLGAGPQKRRLQLVKIALDLVGRPPTAVEITRLDRGAALDELVDEYLLSKEFEAFYFHRIRLFLESQGTELQDEPVRVWCYVAFNDRPFQEILTADYTVDTDFRRTERPGHHGRSGILTTAGFIEGKPGLPHFNYAAQVAEKFLGYVFDVPDSVVKERENATALSTTDPDGSCYSCHKLLTPLAHQRLRWDDQGRYRERDKDGDAIDDSDRGLVPPYPFRGGGMEAFATGAVRKERFIRTMINLHFIMFFNREMRHRTDERVLYRELWDQVHGGGFRIRGLIKAIVSSPEYLEGRPRSSSSAAGAAASTQSTKPSGKRERVRIKPSLRVFGSE